MALPLDLIESVKNHSDIVDIISRYIEVIPKGKSYVALCPFHDDSNPSMQISKDKQIFKCFVCNTGGNVFSFVSKYEHIGFEDAVRKVAELSGFYDPRLEKKEKVTPKDSLIVSLEKCINDLTMYYQYALSTAEGKEGLDYFSSRHLDANMRKKFMLGYAFKDGKNTVKYLETKGHSLKSMEQIGIATGSATNTTYSDKNAGRVIFPLCNEYGQVIGFSARQLKKDGTAKYINSPETPLFHKSKVLYNFHNAKDAAKHEGYVYVLEGFMDVYALERIGIHSAVALMGTAFTEDHLKMLRSLGVELRICLDGDNPGQAAEMKMINQLKKSGLNYRFVDNQGSPYDPDEILNNQGELALKEYLNNLINPIDFIFKYYRQNASLSTMDDRKKLVAYFLPILAAVDSRLELEDYLIKLSQVTKFDVESLRTLVKEEKNKKGNESAKNIISNFHPERKAIKRFALAEREILYFMLKDPMAIEFYENRVEAFYDDIYRRIADYILEYYSTLKNVDISGVISTIESKDDAKAEELINEITILSEEKNHPKVISKDYLENCYQTINEEKEKISKKNILESLLQGKSEMEKAKIISEWNYREAKNKK